MKIFTDKVSLVSLLFIFLISLPTYGMESAWDGWYGGLDRSYKSSNSTTNYSHAHIGNCINLNFGSEWPGDFCEGNQDYKLGVNSSMSSSATGLYVERLWSGDERVYGWHFGVVDNSEPVATESKLLSNAWGDTLNFDVRLKESVNLRAIIGFPQENWLPFISMGVVFQRGEINLQQDQPPYNLPVRKAKEHWVTGGVFGAGFKKYLNPDWLLTTEFFYQKLNSFDLSSQGGIFSYGIRYPDTNIEVNSESKVLRIGVARKF